jgi:hypothetical protein
MGEYADYALDDAWEDWEVLQKYREGNMNLAEAYDAGIIDEFGAEIGDSRLPGRTVTNVTRRSRGKPSVNFSCKYCGETNLKWKSTGGSWRLHNGSNLHTCQEYKR